MKTNLAIIMRTNLAIIISAVILVGGVLLSDLSVVIKILILSLAGFIVLSLKLFVDNLKLKEEKAKIDETLSCSESNLMALRRKNFLLLHAGKELVIEDHQTGEPLGLSPKMTAWWQELVCPVVKVSSFDVVLIGTVVKKRGRFYDGSRGYGYWYGDDRVDVSVYHDAVDCRAK